jgi:mcrBC 5-methylcytosine restriction system component-like protein
VFAEFRQEIKTGYIGAIPVRNLWLLMLYASDWYRELPPSRRSEVEDAPDEIPDLIAEILCHRVEHRLRRNLSYGYQRRQDVLSRLRGHIELLKTERRHLLQRGKIACSFAELTVNTVRNRYVRAALTEIAKMVQNESLAQRCRSLAVGLGRLGVSGECPTHHKITTDVIARHHAGDRPMMDAAHLAFHLALPTEMAGDKSLPLPERNIVWIRRLYEKAIAGFYRAVLDSAMWRVDAGKWLSWPITQASDNIEKIFPAMQTDIVLENRAEKRRLIIDTKFNALLTKGRHREESLRSGYLYQIYAYLRSQEKAEDALARHATGLLLHPAINCSIDEYVVIQGHEIRFATVDLSATAAEIRRRLLQLIEQ